MIFAVSYCIVSYCILYLFKDFEICSYSFGGKLILYFYEILFLIKIETKSNIELNLKSSSATLIGAQEKLHLTRSYIYSFTFCIECSIFSEKINKELELRGPRNGYNINGESCHSFSTHYYVDKLLYCSKWLQCQVFRCYHIRCCG